MRTLTITLSLVLSVYYSCAQKTEKTKQFFEKIVSQKPYDKILQDIKVVIKDKDIEDIQIEKYNLKRVYNNLDFNKDGNNDLMLYIDKNVSEDDKFKAKEASNYKYRILLLLIFNKANEYILQNIFISLLNQNTEGLFCNSLKIEVISDNLYIKEFGRQIDTDWATEMIFSYNKSMNNWFLKKCAIYKAEITSDEEKLIKQIKEHDINEIIPIDSVSYYKYFPFGFSDDVY